MPANLRTPDVETAYIPRSVDFEALPAGQLARATVAVTETIQRSFLKSAESELSELLHEPVAMSYRDAVQSTFSRALKGGAGDREIGLDLSPLHDSGFLVFPSVLLFRVLDILLATPENTPADNPPDQRPRTVTGIELYILQEFFEVFAHSLRDAWAPIYPAAFTQIPPADDGGPGISEIGDEPALVLRADFELAGTKSDFLLVLPTFLPRMAQLKSEAATGRQNPGERPVGNIVKCLGSASLSVEAVLGGATIRIRDLLGMTPGQILTIGNSEDTAGFECRVNGRQQFTGELVPSGGRCAMRIAALTGQNPAQAKAE